MEVAFTVYGDPVAQGRPKFFRHGNNVGAYDPQKSKTYKQNVRDEALKVKPPLLLDGALSLSIRVYRSIPKSFSKKKKAAAQNGELRPVTKPDLDNVIKGVKDSLKSVIWRDDSQVVDLDQCGKWYSDIPRIEVTIREL